MLVSIRKKVKGGRTYYYLKHNAGTFQREAYLGTQIPKNIVHLKRQFLIDLQRERWIPSINSIKKGYSENRKKTPNSILEQNLIEFSYYFTHDTQKIEGSSLTQQETYNLLRFHITPDKKPESDMIEAQRHHDVFLKIMDSARDISLKSVLSWHSELFKKTKPEFAGKVRHFPIWVTGSNATFPHARFVPAFLKDFFSWYKKSKATVHPVELAGLAHFRFVNIHPFGDGNGRVSRLIMNKILHQSGFPLLNIRYAERKFYYAALEKGNLKSEEMYFLKWFVKKYISENKRYAEM